MENKIILPSVLATLVVISAVFAFMPVQNASTVHDNIAENNVRVLTETDVTLADDGTDQVCTISAVGDSVIVHNIYLDNTPTSDAVADNSVNTTDLLIAGSEFKISSQDVEMDGLKDDNEITDFFSEIEIASSDASVNEISIPAGETFVFALDNDDAGSEQIIDITVAVQGNSSTTFECEVEDIG